MSSIDELGEKLHSDAVNYQYAIQRFHTLTFQLLKAIRELPISFRMKKDMLECVWDAYFFARGFPMSVPTLKLRNLLKERRHHEGGDNRIL